MEENPPRPFRLLLVEDSELQRRATVQILEEAGYEVSVAEDGLAGVYAAWSAPPDAVVTDVVMPELNGYQLCRLLKDDPQQGDVPIVVLTAHEEPIDRFWATQCGADRFVPKTEVQRELLPALEAVLEGREAGSHPESASERVDADELRHRVSATLERLLQESTLRARFRLISVEVDDPRRPLDELLELLTLLTGASAGAIRLDLGEGPCVFARAVRRDLREAIRAKFDLETSSPWVDVDSQTPTGKTRGEGRLDALDLEGEGSEAALILLRPPKASPLRGPLVSVLVEETRLFARRLVAAQQVRVLRRSLQTAYEEAERLLSAISYVLVGVDEQGVVRRWNGTAEEAFGIPADAAIGKAFLDLEIAWCDPSEVAALLERLSREGGEIERLRYQDPFTRERLISGRVSPLGTPEAPAGFVLIAADVTERVRMEAELDQARKLESIGRLAAGVAHEINTPAQFLSDNTLFLQQTMRTLDPLIERALEEGIEGVDPQELEFLREEVPEALQQSLEGIERISNIVRAMKDFSHPGFSTKTPFDLNEAVRMACTVTKNSWKHHAEIELDLADDLPEIEALAGEIKQVILNLIVNASDAIAEQRGPQSKEKGKIRISTRPAGHDTVELIVEDDGTGIPPKIRDRVFDPFFTTKQVGQGTGQGLYIAHQVVVGKHGGSLDLESPPEGGARFRIRLPLEAEGVVASGASPYRASA